MEIAIGIANSVSANFEYDPIDALHFAQQSEFPVVQLYITEKMLKNEKKMEEMCQSGSNIAEKIFFIHADASFNRDFFESQYYDDLFVLADELGGAEIIVHFDENSPLEENLKLVTLLAGKNRRIYIENFYAAGGVPAAEKNMRKYLALFTLSGSHGHGEVIRPVLDLPRFFHNKLAFETPQALQWCYQMFNFFSNKRIPVVLHLIDSKNGTQERNSFCPVGEGIIPYNELFDFINKTNPQISAIILEYEDKLNPLKARKAIFNYLK